MDDRLTDADLRVLLANAKAGPWRLIWWGSERFPYPLSIDANNGGEWVARGGEVSSEANARLIAQSPELAAELLELRAKVAELEAQEALYRQWLDKIRKRVTAASENTVKILERVMLP